MTQAGPIRVAELMAALSLATDLAMGQPMEYALTACVVAMRLGETLGLTPTELREVYYQSLLRYIGCNAETSVLSAVVGDEQRMRRDFATLDPANTPHVIRLVMRYMRESRQGMPPLQLARSLVGGLLAMPRTTREAFAGHCEVAERLATRLGFEPPIVGALGQLYERWDGKGLPHGLKGEAVALAVRVVTLAQDAVTFQRLGGIDAAIGVARERNGGAYDPRLATCFCEHAPALFSGLNDEPTWEMVLALEPGGQQALTEEGLDTACGVIADFADIKSPWTLGHSTGVAQLAGNAARVSGLPAADADHIRRAGLLHDVGMVGVSNSVWEKPGALSERDLERIRLHTYYTERILVRPTALAGLGTLASFHHERLDGSGYHRAAVGNSLPLHARLLAAADSYHALTEARRHRPARTPDEAEAELRRDVRAGKLDEQAVNAVLTAAGHRVSRVRRKAVGGLSEREIEVLRLLARGHTIREMAASLVIAEKTVDNHIQHIYEKIGVSTRAGATLFAMEHNLLAPEAIPER